MKNFDASERNGAGLHCLVCERQILDDNWFARIKQGNRRVAFCRPWCTELFLDDREKYLGRLEKSWAVSPGDADWVVPGQN